MKAFITSDAAKAAPARIRSALIFGGEVAAGEIPAFTRPLPICGSIVVVGCVAGAGYVGWKIGGALNRWLGISASFLPPFDSTTHRTSKGWRWSANVSNYGMPAPPLPGRTPYAVTSTGITVDIDRINCNSTGTGPGDKPCSAFYGDFQRLLDSQPGTPLYWGTGTQGCGYGTCYAKYILDDDFLPQLQVTVEPYTNQRVDWIDAAPSGTGTITSDELQRYRDKVRSASNRPAPENYVNSTLDPDNWWPPTNTPGEDGGVRADWSTAAVCGGQPARTKLMLPRPPRTRGRFLRSP